MAVSTETPRYISFSGSLVRYFLSVARFHRVYTLFDLSLAYSLYGRVVGEREKLVTIQLHTFNAFSYGAPIQRCLMLLLADLIVGVQTAARAPFVHFISGTHGGVRQRSELEKKESLFASQVQRTKIFRSTGRNTLYPSLLLKLFDLCFCKVLIKTIG